MALAADVANLVVALRLDDSGFSGKLNAAARQLRDMDSGLSQMGRGAGQVAGGIARIGAVAGVAAAGGIGAVVTTAAKYEEAFTGVEKTVEGTVEEFEELEDTIKRMAGSTGTSFEDLAAIGETGGALGVGIDTLDEFIDVVNRLSVSTPLSADAAATALGQIGNVLGFTSEDYETFADSLVALGNAGASTEDQIIDIAARFGAAARSAGLSNEEILALSSTVASMGIDAEAGGSSLSRLFNNVTLDIGTASDEAELLAESMGLSLDELRDAWEKDAGAVFEDLLGYIRDLDQFEAAEFLSGLGITNTRDINTIRTLASGVDEYGRQLDVAEEGAGSLREESDKFFSTTAANWDKVIQNVRNAADTIGQELLPVVNDLMEDFVGWLAEPDTQQGLKDFAKDLAEGVRGFVDELKGTDFSGLLGGVKLAAEVAKGAFDAFRALPEPVQQLAIAALVANKVTGGAVGSIAAGLGNLVLGGLKTITATHVTVVGGTVTGGPGGGIPGGGGGGGGGFIGGLKTGGALAAPFLAGTAAAMTVDFVGDAARNHQGMHDSLESLPRDTAAELDESIAKVEGAIEVANNSLIDSWVSETGGINARLEQELSELQAIKASNERGEAAARDAIPWLQRNRDEIHNFNMSEGTRWGQSLAKQDSAIGATRTGNMTLEQIRAKKSSVNVTVNTNVSLSTSQVIHQVQQLRQTIDGGGFI